MIEQFNPEHRDILSITDHRTRWEQLLKLNYEDHNSFRVLFSVETLATMEWKEPKPERLNELLDLVIKGTHLAVKFDNILNLIQVVWPLQLAKREVQKMRLLWEPEEWKRFPIGSIALPIVGCITTWWAFETILNDIAGILRDVRASSLTEETRLCIEEKTVAIDNKGKVVEKTIFQPIEARMRFIFNFATGQVLQSSDAIWGKVLALKKARDVAIHRLAKKGTDEASLTQLHKTVAEGLNGVSQILQRIFTETAEFRERHVYKYISYWGCEVEDPIFWDGKEGDGFYFGPAKSRTADIINVIAPEPALVKHSGIQGVR
jgi:hypothetical protein